jgi:hypothetical protein
MLSGLSFIAMALLSIVATVPASNPTWSFADPTVLYGYWVVVVAVAITGALALRRERNAAAALHAATAAKLDRILEARSPAELNALVKELQEQRDFAETQADGIFT